MYSNAMSLIDFDPELAKWVDLEQQRQEEHIELIASERHHSLTKLLKSDHLCQESKLSLIQKVSMLIKEEHTLANEIKSKDKSHFVLKRHAVKAYMQKAA